MNPFFRILRFEENPLSPQYIYDASYAHNRIHTISAYHVILQDLKKLLEYIDPSDNNLQTYSFRTYELLLRIATEFESNCKEILLANHYSKNRSENYNIIDYHKINAANKISEYFVKINIWSPNPKEIKPWQEWNKNYSLKWYTDYNLVKHDRSGKFNLANLDNVINGAASLTAILFSQFGPAIFDPYQDTYSYNFDSEKYNSTTGSLFSVNPYRGWDASELYNNSNIIDKFSF